MVKLLKDSFEEENFNFKIVGFSQNVQMAADYEKRSKDLTKFKKSYKLPMNI